MSASEHRHEWVDVSTYDDAGTVLVCPCGATRTEPRITVDLEEPR